MKNKIYQDDKLYRKQFVQKIISFTKTQGDINNLIVLNGQFGSGKSVVFSFLFKELELDDSVDVIMHNVWEDNFFDNPMIPLLNSLNDIKTKKDEIKLKAKKILKYMPKVLFSLIKEQCGIDLNLINYNEDLFDEYNQYKNALEEYKTLLGKVSSEKKIILLIDELDRCLPEYQIKTLEMLHVFASIPNFIIIIAIDYILLEKVIEGIYGNANVYGYLSKFIDYQFELPSINDKDYIKTELEFNEEVSEICTRMYKMAKLSIRDQLHMVKSLNIIFSNMDIENYEIPVFVNLVLIIKYKYHYLYKKYFFRIQDEEEYNTEYNLKLDNCLYNYFLTDIIGTNLELLIQNFKDKTDFILYLINFFCPLQRFDLDNLSEYVNLQKEDISLIIKKSYSNMYYFNKKLLEKINCLI